jgi:hypothetical protein
VEKTDYLAHDKALALTAQSAILLLPINNTPNLMGITPGKLFEYLALKRPILVTGPEEGDTAKIVAKTNSGEVAGFNNSEKMKDLLLGWRQKFEEGSLQSTLQGAEEYSRRNLTHSMSLMLQQISEK